MYPKLINLLVLQFISVKMPKSSCLFLEQTLIKSRTYMHQDEQTEQWQAGEQTEQWQADEQTEQWQADEQTEQWQADEQTEQW
jgi:hypothetical protein